jgi:hypothetical protein
MINYTHFVTRPENPAIAQVFTGYYCHTCHCLHRKKGEPTSNSPWGKAVFAGLDRVIELPEEGCPRNK